MRLCQAKNITTTRTSRRKVLGLLVNGDKPQEISTLKEITPLALTFRAYR
ncbi:hypothetical protein HW132_08115 [Brasilonema sp. CT11]|nr:hypothetical protein [Brasilonema sp. CT11]